MGVFFANFVSALLTAAPFVLIGLLILIPMWFRRVVEPNEVHIVQTRKKTVSYGKDKPNGGAYYEWPHWLPILGVQVVKLKISVFDLELRAYDAYDQGRVPFVADVVGFFRIKESNIAAERVSSQEELEEQLKEVLRGATRSILAQHDIEEIMTERAKFGQLFTQEVQSHLAEWGVEHVKTIELMDIRDPDDRSSQTISNIMAKKQSLIDRESRVEVASNKRQAEIAEVDATRDVDVRRQDARQQVGQREADADKQIGISKEKAAQEIKTEQKETATREMMVREVETVRLAEIDRQAAEIKADQDRKVVVIGAEAQKEKQAREAEGYRDAEQFRAEGILAVGKSDAEARRLMELAPVSAQIELAHEIGENKPYQEYLISIRQVEAGEKIGVEQAQALVNADIKIIANGGDVGGGMRGVGELFSASGGTKLAGMAGAFLQSEKGRAIAESLGLVKEEE